MAKFFSTDKIIAIFLGVALLVSLFVSSSVELQATIAAGLVGYLGKTAGEISNHKALIEDTLKQLAKDEILKLTKKG